MNLKGTIIIYGLKIIFNDFFKTVKKNLTALEPKYPTYAIPKASPKLQLAPLTKPYKFYLNYICYYACLSNSYLVSYIYFYYSSLNSFY